MLMMWLSMELMLRRLMPLLSMLLLLMLRELVLLLVWLLVPVSALPGQAQSLLAARQRQFQAPQELASLSSLPVVQSRWLSQELWLMWPRLQPSAQPDWQELPRTWLH
jgi:hypothetical protein